MYRKKLLVPALLLVLVAPLASAQDVTDGTLLGYDRKANLLILKDRTVWSLTDLKSALPDGLKAGDRIRIQYQSDEDGISAINSVEVLPPRAAQSGPKDITEGTVLAYDRKAKLLVLRDRTAWSLAEMKSAIPEGLKDGVRIEIQYEADEDGIASIDSIRVLSN